MFSRSYHSILILVLRGYWLHSFGWVGGNILRDNARISTDLDVQINSNYVPPLLLELYDQMTQGKRDKCLDKVVQTILAKEIEVTTDGNTIIKFSANLKEPETEIHNSELHLEFAGPTNNFGRVQLTTSVDFIVAMKRSNFTNRMQSNTEIYQLTDIMRNQSSQIDFKFVRETDGDDTEVKHAFIIFMEKRHCNEVPPEETTPKNRRRRSLSATNSFTGCRRTSEMVYFSDIGWDNWIIQPTAYQKYRCEGGCRFPTITQHTVKSSKVALIHAMLFDRRQRETSAYCAPSKLSSLTMLYRDANNHDVIHFGEYPELVVDSCACV